jgi:hypothetical protein
MFGRDKKLEERLRKEGMRAPAEVLEADSSYGITTGNPAFVANTEIVWKLKLQVKPEGEPPFTADVKARFPQLGGPARGGTLSVLYDPQDHSKVVVDQSVEGHIETMAARVAADHPENPALATSIDTLMHEAMADPAAFREKMREQAAAGLNPLGMPVTSFGAAAPDPADQLTKLADLRDRGALSEEEFAAAKKRILGT